MFFILYLIIFHVIHVLNDRTIYLDGFFFLYVVIEKFSSFSFSKGKHLLEGPNRRHGMV